MPYDTVLETMEEDMDQITNWTCDCGFPYNYMGMKECDECGKQKPEDAPITEHKVIGTTQANNVSFDD